MYSILDINLTITCSMVSTSNRRSYMSVHVIFKLLNELWKRDIASFHNEFDKFNKTGARMLFFYLYHMTMMTLKLFEITFWLAK